MLRSRVRWVGEPMDSSIRTLKASDLPYMRTWFEAEDTLKWFPMQTPDELEIDLNIWIQYAQYGAAVTLDIDGTPAGSAVLYLQPCRRQMHQCLFAIIVDNTRRGQGVGTRLMKGLMRLAREQFYIEMLQLEVYDGNPAKDFYKRLGFVEYGREKDYVRRKGESIDKIMMYKWI